MMIKKFFGGLALMAAFTAPVTMTSCNDDDVNTVLNIIDQILSGNDLAGTGWLTQDKTVGVEFTDNTNGKWYDQSNMEGVAFTYKVDTQNSIVTLTFANGSVQFTVLQFEKGKYLVMKNNSQTFTFYDVSQFEG